MNEVDANAFESVAASVDLDEPTNLIPLVPTVSKNQLKRLRRDEYLRDKKKQRKEAEKAAKRARSENAATQEDGKLDAIVEGKVSVKDSNSADTKDVTRSQKRSAELAEFLNRCDKNYSIIIDCNWESSHSESDLRSLSQQIMFCYSCNKNSSNSSNIILSGVGPLLKAKLEKMHCNNWIGVTIHSKDVLNAADNEQISPDNAPKISLPEKDSIIYLTSDAEETIHSLDPSCSYVIGGIVDRNRLKGATYKKAKELGIRTAKLPIKEYFALSATHVLTVNHVFEILLKRGELNSWPAALESVLPKRKAPKAVSSSSVDEVVPVQSDKEGSAAAATADDQKFVDQLVSSDS